MKLYNRVIRVTYTTRKAAFGMYPQAFPLRKGFTTKGEIHTEKSGYATLCSPRTTNSRYKTYKVSHELIFGKRQLRGFLHIGDFPIIRATVTRLSGSVFIRD